jgi:hypothetical protein
MCTICQHPARPVIERDLLACPSVGAVAANHRLFYHEAVKHKARLQARVEHARQQVEQLQLTESLAQLHLLVEKTMKVVAAAEEKGDLKLMLQAIREAERLTKMIHSLAVDLEPSALFLAATHPDWPRAATPLPNQSWVRDSVRQAMQHYLKNPCQGSHYEDDLSPPSRPPLARPVAALRKGRNSSPPSASMTRRPSAGGDAVIVGAAIAPLGTLTAVGHGRDGPG